MLQESGGGRGQAAIGGSGNNTIDLSSFTGSYYIEGEAGDDTLTASAGGCDLHGGTGADTLLGGNGGDEFEFAQGREQLHFSLILSTTSLMMATPSPLISGVDLRYRISIVVMQLTLKRLTISHFASRNRKLFPRMAWSSTRSIF